MASELSNHYKFMLKTKKIDFENDSFKIILMDTGFTFNKDTHATFADVSASELATGNGYTQNTKTLGAATESEDDTNDRSETTFAGTPNVRWTASGGSIGPSPGAIIYDDTTTDDTIVGYNDFGSDQTATDGGNFDIDNIAVRST